MSLSVMCLPPSTHFASALFYPSLFLYKADPHQCERKSFPLDFRTLSRSTDGPGPTRGSCGSAFCGFSVNFFACCFFYPNAVCLSPAHKIRLSALLSIAAAPWWWPCALFASPSQQSPTARDEPPIDVGFTATALPFPPPSPSRFDNTAAVVDAPASLVFGLEAPECIIHHSTSAPPPQCRWPLPEPLVPRLFT